MKRHGLSFAIILTGAAMLGVAIFLWHRPAVVWLGFDPSILLLDLFMLAVTHPCERAPVDHQSLELVDAHADTGVVGAKLIETVRILRPCLSQRAARESGASRGESWCGGESLNLCDRRHAK